MKVKEYIHHLNELGKKHPEILEMDVIYSRDDEGNGYQHVHYGPSMGRFEGDSGNWSGDFRTFDPNATDPAEDYCVQKIEDCNAVCIN